MVNQVFFDADSVGSEFARDDRAVIRVNAGGKSTGDLT